MSHPNIDKAKMKNLVKIGNNWRFTLKDFWSYSYFNLAIQYFFDVKYKKYIELSYSESESNVGILLVNRPARY